MDGGRQLKHGNQVRQGGKQTDHEIVHPQVERKACQKNPACEGCENMGKHPVIKRRTNVPPLLIFHGFFMSLVPGTKKKQPQTLQGAQQNLGGPARLQGGTLKKKPKFDLGVVTPKTPTSKPFMSVHRTGYSGSAVFESPAKRDVA